MHYISKTYYKAKIEDPKSPCYCYAKFWNTKFIPNTVFSLRFSLGIFTKAKVEFGASMLKAPHTFCMMLFGS
jgi:hypothetical protein